jgi:hypothetical protein
LIGQFGPLEPGQWTYQAGDLPAHTFTVVPEPKAGISLAAAATILGFRRRNVV